VNEYIASKPKEARVALRHVRKAIRKAVPAAEEGLSYQMPVSILNGVPVLYFTSPAGKRTTRSIPQATRSSPRSRVSFRRTSAAKARSGFRFPNQYP
jgi:hypothetical protein